jgi:putative addiction module antidote
VRYYACTHIAVVLELKLRKVGNSIGVVLPKEALARLNSREGDTLVLTESKDGGFRLGANQSDFGRQMKAAESIIARYRNTLRELQSERASLGVARSRRCVA